MNEPDLFITDQEEVPHPTRKIVAWLMIGLICISLIPWKGVIIRWNIFLGRVAMVYQDELPYLEERNTILALVNNERKQAGKIPFMAASPAATAVAMERARQIADFFSHDPENPNDHTFSQLLTLAGIHWHAVGENIASGYPSPESVHQGWMDSPGHKANIMSNNYEYLAVGFYQDPVSNRKHWAQLFYSVR